MQFNQTYDTPRTNETNNSRNENEDTSDLEDLTEESIIENLNMVVSSSDENDTYHVSKKRSSPVVNKLQIAEPKQETRDAVKKLQKEGENNEEYYSKKNYQGGKVNKTSKPTPPPKPKGLNKTDDIEIYLVSMKHSSPVVANPTISEPKKETRDAVKKIQNETENEEYDLISNYQGNNVNAPNFPPSPPPIPELPINTESTDLTTSKSKEHSEETGNINDHNMTNNIQDSCITIKNNVAEPQHDINPTEPNYKCDNNNEYCTFETLKSLPIQGSYETVLSSVTNNEDPSTEVLALPRNQKSTLSKSTEVLSKNSKDKNKIKPNKFIRFFQKLSIKKNK